MKFEEQNPYASTVVGLPTVSYFEKAKPDAGFVDNFLAQLGYTYAPIYDSFSETSTFGNVPRTKTEFTLEDIEGYEDHVDEIVRGKNDEHVAFIKQSIDENRERRRIMGRANWYDPSSLVAGVLDPLNILFALPIAGQLGLFARGGMTLAQGAKAGFKGGLAYGVVSEGIRAPFDPLNTPTETAINTITATGLGTVFGIAPGVVRSGLARLNRSSDNLNKLANGEEIVDVNNLQKEIIDPETGEVTSNPLATSSKIKDTFFTKYLMNVIPTPGKRIMKNGTEKMREIYQLIEGNGAVAREKDAFGVTGNQSLRQREASYNAEANAFVTSFEKLYVQDIKNSADASPTKVFDINVTSAKARAKKMFGGQTPHFDEWFTNLQRKRILFKDPKQSYKLGKELTKVEQDGIKKLDDYYEIWKEDSKHVGLLQTEAQLRAKKTSLQKRIEDLDQRFEALKVKEKQIGLSKKELNEFNSFQKVRTKVGNRLQEASDMLDQNLARDWVSPIYYNKARLLTDDAYRQGLEKIFARHLRSNPARVYDQISGQYVNRLVDNPTMFARKVVANILEENADAIDFASPSRAGSAKHLKHRVLNIPEHEIVDYMILGPEVVYTYSKKMGKRVEWARNFGDKDIDDLLDDIELDGQNAGFTEKRIAELKRDFSEEIRRITGNIIEDPDRLSVQIAQRLKDIAGMTYLHGAGLSAVNDMGVMVLERGLKRNIAPFFNEADRAIMFKGMKDGPKLIDQIDLSKSFIQQRLVEDSVKRIQPNAVERVFNPITQAYYNIPLIGNNLGFVTKYAKILNGVHAQSDLIEVSLKVKNNTATNFEIEWLGRHFIDLDTAKKFADMPHEKGDKSFYANTDAWARDTPQDRELIRKFQTALNTNTANVIMHATSFDKPMLVNGVFYTKHHPFMNKLGFKIDERASTKNIKMTRIEWQPLGFPFQFMNFGLASSNRIFGAMFDPARKNRVMGALALMFLGYTTLNIRNRNKPWFFEKEPTDIFARTVDFSGILGVYSDIFYMGLHAGVGSGMIEQSDMLMGKYKPDGLDASLEFAGAVPGQLSEFIRAGNDYLNDRPSEGAKRLSRNLPWLSLYGLNDDFRDIAGGR
tara:strand:+ start:2198 stop:5503 length:3306 start_codon:yes stop_codon:yes gene_type:complete